MIDFEQLVGTFKLLLINLKYFLPELIFILFASIAITILCQRYKHKGLLFFVLLLLIFIPIRFYQMANFKVDTAVPDSYLNECHTIGLVDVNRCNFGGSKKIKVVLLGDSHAAQYLWPLSKVTKEKNWGLLSLTKSGCPAMKLNSSNTNHTDCINFNQESLDLIQKLKPDFLFLSNLTEEDKYLKTLEISTEVYSSAVLGLIQYLSPSVKNIYYISDSPYPQFDHFFCYKYSKFFGSRDSCKIPNTKTMLTQAVADNIGEEFEVIDSRQYLCPGNEWCFLGRDINIYRDGSHLSKSGSLIMYSHFLKVLSK
jgi:hypothetical protein